MSAPTAAPTDVGRPARVGLALVGILLIAVNLRVSFVSVGPLLGQLRADLGLGAAAAGLLTSLPLVGFALFSPLAPAAARRLGLDRTLWVALAVLSGGILLRSAALPGAVWIGTGLLGLAIAFLNVLLPGLVKRDFPHRVGGVTGIYFALTTIVAALGSGLVVPIAGDAPNGWRLALGVWAGLGLLALAWFLPRLRRRAAAAAEDAGQAPEYRSPWTSALGWQVTLFMGLQSLPFFVLATWLPSIEASYGVDAVTSGWHLFWFQVCGVLGSLSMPAVLHRLPDQRLPGAAASLLALAAYLGLMLAPGMSLLWTVLLGLACGSSIVVALSLFSLRTRHHQQAAALSGMAQSVGYLLAAAAPIGFGALYDLTGGWTLPLGLTAVLMVFMGVFAVLAGRRRYID
ncbi:CynX/NimT family MFS transporter [Arthrobacter mobilis]|uniref:MFS transporter n=1 Tax=Arthrobacter mobilis TaxID=2724944 RepID=A0A7X6H9K4_9MICC|nr:MFS transporter [Arthrobacter mobilis]NKX52993.1 MFS transporter [Arthrobacter mobilis]